MMKNIKRIISLLIAMIISMLSFVTVSAQQMKMYIREYYVERDIVTYAGIDMLPISDIACELGYSYGVADYGFVLNSSYATYNFTLGDATVHNNTGRWIGLDAVPMVLNKKMRIPSTFVSKTLGMSYTWDSESNIIFIASPNAYERVKSERQTKDAQAVVAASTVPAVSYSSNSSTGNYIGNANTYKFHKPSCGYLPASYNRIYYSTRSAAINAGMVPCKRCRP